MTLRTERSEDQTLALLRHREKQDNGICPLCLDFLDWGVSHEACIEALSPSKVERRKAPMGVDYMAHEENPEV